MEKPFQIANCIVSKSKHASILSRFVSILLLSELIERWVRGSGLYILGTQNETGSIIIATLNKIPIEKAAGRGYNRGEIKIGGHFYDIYKGYHRR